MASNDESLDIQPEPPSNELSSSEKEVLLGWLSRLCDDTLSGDETDSLRNWLEASEGARAEYLQFFSLHASLGAASNLPSGLSQHDQEAEPSSVRRSLDAAVSKFSASRWTQLLVAASVAVVAVGSWFFAWRGDRPREGIDRARVSYIAQILAAENCEWSLRSGATRPNGLLHRQDALVVDSGEATVRLMNGVEMAMRGPTQIAFVSDTSCELKKGQVRARVPRGAEGFVIRTPLGYVVDLGTEFGVSVDNQVAVRVFQGEIELYPSPFVDGGHSARADKDSMISLDAGDGGTLIPGDVDAKAKFVSQSSLEVGTLLPDFNKLTRKHTPPIAIESFSQGEAGARARDRNGGLGWSGDWRNEGVESNSVSFLVHEGRLLSRGTGSGAIQRRLAESLHLGDCIYFSAEFELHGTDPVCSAWLEIYQHDTDRWSNGETDLAAIGITDGQFSGRLAPWKSQSEEKTIGDCGAYAVETRHLIVGRLEFDVNGDQDRLSVWVNPDLDDEASPDVVMLKEARYASIDSVALRCWEMDGDATALIDDVRIADTWRLVVE